MKNLETPGKTWRVGRYATEILWNGSDEIGMGPQKERFGSGTIWSVNNLSVPNFICAKPKFFTCWDLQQGSPSIGENGTGAEKSVRLRLNK